MHTSAGTLALENHISSHDAFLVEKLRNAGAVILGKANMTELANGMSNTMWAGYSSRGGQVLNPYGDADLLSGDPVQVQLWQLLQILQYWLLALKLMLLF